MTAASRYKDDGDRSRLLEIVAQAMARFDVLAHAYCLMDNHYHFALQTRQANLSRMPRARHVSRLIKRAEL